VTDQELLKCYTDFVPFLAAVCGPGCEIVIHDVTNPEQSIIAIGNGISGRELGDPMTDFARELQEKGTYADTECLLNYKGKTKSGEFLSSTYFIKNEGRLIGMLCVNKELAAAQELNLALRALLDRFNLSAPPEDSPSEDLSSPLESVMHSRIAEIISREGTAPAHMSMQEKIRVVHKLDADGILMMKGAVAEIADQLSVSVPTIYRYLNKPQA